MAEGSDRAMQAAQKAISSPLLEDSSVHGARGVIINVTGGPDLSLMEVNEASCVIQEAAHEDANIIFGAVVDPQLVGKVKITVIATGFDRKIAGRGVVASASQTPVDLTNYTQHLNRPAEPPAAAASIKPRMTSSTPDLPLQGPPMEHAASLSVSRRAGIEMAVPTGPATVSAAAPAENELQTPFDVPAFLRRPH
jgi:cell division protein FtsZ